MDAQQGESIRFWQTPPLTGVELLTARYIEHRFVPHVHDGFVIGMIIEGAQRYRYRGAEHLAATGTLVLINPDEVHNGHKGHDAGWRYRAFYPDNAQSNSCWKNWNCPPATCRPSMTHCCTTAICFADCSSYINCSKGRRLHCSSKPHGAR